MRDLAQQSYVKDKIAIPQSTVRILLLLAGALVFLLGAKFIISQVDSNGSSITLRDAPKGLTPVGVPGGFDVNKDAINLALESATFSNVSGENARATATRKYGDGSYSLTVNATLPDPIGNVYQVWIVGKGEVNLAGNMRGSGNIWSVVFNDVDNYSDLDEIWITREITNNDGRAEKHILEGTF